MVIPCVPHHNPLLVPPMHSPAPPHHRSSTRYVHGKCIMSVKQSINQFIYLYLYIFHQSTNQSIYLSLSIYFYRSLSVCVCVCACVYVRAWRLLLASTILYSIFPTALIIPHNSIPGPIATHSLTLIPPLFPHPLTVPTFQSVAGILHRQGRSNEVHPQAGAKRRY